MRVFYGTEKREGERLEIYGRDIAPAAAPVYQISNIMYIMYICNTLN